MNKSFYKNTVALILAAAVCLSAWALIAFAPAKVVFAADNGTLTVHFIDCGQADACVIEFPDGKNMLIDAGENKSASYGNIITYIKDKTDITAFDYFIMTHSDADHIGGAVKVLSEYPATTVYRPNQAAEYTTPSDTKHYVDPACTATGSAALRGEYTTKNADTYVRALEKAYAVAENVYVTDPRDNLINNISGTSTVIGESVPYTFDFYSPLSYAYLLDNNNYSPIMVLSYAGRNIVLSGDAEAENEAEFVNLVRDSDENARYDRFRVGFDADIIKMGHHGSDTSSSEKYLSIIGADETARCNTFTIFSCGENKAYGHPHEKTLQRLMKMKFSPTRIRRTDLHGTIRFDVNSKGDISEKHDKDAELNAVLTCGLSNNQNTHPLVTVGDNGVRPTDESGEIVKPQPTPDPTPTPTPESAEPLPKLYDNPLTAFWNGLSPTGRIVAVAVIVVLLIALIVLSVVVTRRRSKKRQKDKKSTRR